jgi:hypothetical protein
MTLTNKGNFELFFVTQGSESSRNYMPMHSVCGFLTVAHI